MTYILQITQLVENVDYKEQSKAYKDSIRYSQYDTGMPLPPKTTEKRKLDIEITDAEWEAIKKEVLKVI